MKLLTIMTAVTNSRRAKISLTILIILFIIHMIDLLVIGLSCDVFDHTYPIRISFVEQTDEVASSCSDQTIHIL